MAAWFHRLIRKTMRANVNHIWGVSHYVRNDNGEDFGRGSIAVCIHLSRLDALYLLALNPKVVIMTSGKRWNHSIFSPILKSGRFINGNHAVEEDVVNAVKDGYSVVVSDDAFHLARKSNADILPLYIHGTDDVMPEESSVLARGQVDVEIGKRIPATELQKEGVLDYQQHLAEWSRSIENTHYFHHYIIYKYIYKGIGLEKETRRLLKRHDDFSKWIDISDAPAEVNIIDAGHGQFSLLYALVHPETQINSYAYDEDDVALASSCDPMPRNLHVHYCKDHAAAVEEAGNGNVISLSTILA